MYLVGIILPFIYGAHWAFYLYEITYFLNPNNRWWSSLIPSLPYSKITVIIMILIFIINNKKYQKNKLTNLPQFKWFILLLLSYVLVDFYAILPVMHHSALIEFAKLFLIIGLAYKVLDSEKKLEWALFAYMLGATYLSYETYNVGRDSFGRVEGVGLVDAPDSNGASATLVPVLPLLIFYFWFGSKKVKLAIVIAGGLIVNALILINSRGAFVGGAASVVYLLWGMFNSKLKVRFQKLMVVTLIIFGIAGLSILIDDTFYDRMLTLTNVEDEKTSGSHRFRMWLSTFELIGDHPFGVGAYGFEALSRTYVDEELFIGGQQTKAVHSIWFQSLSEVGLHGFVFFIMIIISTFIMAKRALRACEDNNNLYQYYLMYALLSSFIGVLVTSTFINQFRVQLVYWTILFIACFHSAVVVRDEE